MELENMELALINMAEISSPGAAMSLGVLPSLGATMFLGVLPTLRAAIPLESLLSQEAAIPLLHEPTHYPGVIILTVTHLFQGTYLEMLLRLGTNPQQGVLTCQWEILTREVVKYL